MRSGDGLIVSILLLGAAACGQNSDAGAPVPSFYDPPSPLGSAAPGTVIRTGDVPGTPGGIRAQRIMYHSRTNLGEDIATTGLLVIPDTDPPPGGFPLVAAAHGTTGIVQTCAPSIDPFTPNPEIEGGRSFYQFFYEPWVQAGYAVVGADYQGLGAPGPYSYFVGRIEGQNVLDSVRAAKSLSGAIGEDLILFGHSQGGNSAGYAAEILPTYAPELRPGGTILAAPAARLVELLTQAYAGGPGATVPYEAVVFFYLAGLSYEDAYAELSLDSLLSDPWGPQAVPIFQNVCAATGGAAFLLNSLVGELFDPPLPSKPDQFFVPVSQFPPEWIARIAENSLGSRPIGSPILMVQGCADTTIPVATNFTYFEDELCPDGETAEFTTYRGQSHSGVVVAAFPEMIEWANRRLAGEPAPSNCAAPPTCP